MAERLAEMAQKHYGEFGGQFEEYLDKNGRKRVRPDFAKLFDCPTGLRRPGSFKFDHKQKQADHAAGVYQVPDPDNPRALLQPEFWTPEHLQNYEIVPDLSDPVVRARCEEAARKRVPAVQRVRSVASRVVHSVPRELFGVADRILSDLVESAGLGVGLAKWKFYVNGNDKAIIEFETPADDNQVCKHGDRVHERQRRGQQPIYFTIWFDGSTVRGYVNCRDEVGSSLIPFQRLHVGSIAAARPVCRNAARLDANSRST